MPTLTKQAPERRFSGAVAHDFGSHHRKQKAPEGSPRQCVMGFFASKAASR